MVNEVIVGGNEGPVGVGNCEILGFKVIALAREFCIFPLGVFAYLQPVMICV